MIKKTQMQAEENDTLHMGKTIGVRVHFSSENREPRESVTIFFCVIKERAINLGILSSAKNAL